MRYRLLPLLAAAGLALASAAVAEDKAAAPSPGQTAVATFAGGCFWCEESAFDPVEGVLSTTSGYTGGTKVDPTYHEVSAGGTGHAESVEVIYDPSKVTYQQLLDVYWHNVDPLDTGGQFCDRGNQYRSAIFYHDDEQKRLAEASKQALTDSQRFDQPIATEIVAGRPILPGRGLPPGLLSEEPGPVQILPLELRSRPASGRTLGCCADPLSCTPTLTRPHHGGGGGFVGWPQLFSSLPPCGGGPGWGVRRWSQAAGLGGRTRSSAVWAIAAVGSPPPATVTVGKANLMPLASNAFLIMP